MNEIPLCVDLDGTLILTDSLVESLLRAMTDDRGLIFRIPFWLLRGRAHLKQMMASNVSLDVSSLPLNQPLLDYLKAQRATGRKLVLVTAADRDIAIRMATFVGLFDEILASDGVTNLAGSKKAEALQARFGKEGFDYAGNERRDLAVWAVARRAIVVSNNPDLARKAVEVCEMEKSFAVPPPTPRDWFQALRVHQWTKNLLLFLPILCAHEWRDVAKLSSVMIAFVVFCFGTSSVYILNDLLDLESDRHHPSKHRRPFASGRIPLPMGMGVMVAFFALAAVIAVLTQPWTFCAVFAGYYLLTLLYSYRFKRIVLIDVFVLASLYCIRILAGGESTQVTLSHWLLAFALFLFLSLALAKRYTELRATLSTDGIKLKGRGYEVVDLEMVGTMGIVSGYIAALVLAFYTSSLDVVTLYRHPGALWGACVVVLYWISRVWLLAHRGVLHDDPVIFAIKDRQSWLAGLVLLLIAMAAMPK